MDMLTSRLLRLTSQTALLEACSWDEDAAVKAIKDVEKALRLYINESPQETLGLVQEYLIGMGYDKVIIDAVINLIQVEINSVISSMEIEA